MTDELFAQDLDDKNSVLPLEDHEIDRFFDGVTYHYLHYTETALEIRQDRFRIARENIRNSLRDRPNLTAIFTAYARGDIEAASAYYGMLPHNLKVNYLDLVIIPAVQPKSASYTNNNCNKLEQNLEERRIKRELHSLFISDTLINHDLPVWQYINHVFNLRFYRRDENKSDLNNFYSNNSASLGVMNFVKAIYSIHQEQFNNPENTTQVLSSLQNLKSLASTLILKTTKLKEDDHVVFNLTLIKNLIDQLETQQDLEIEL